MLVAVGRGRERGGGRGGGGGGGGLQRRGGRGGGHARGQAGARGGRAHAARAPPRLRRRAQHARPQAAPPHAPAQAMSKPADCHVGGTSRLEFELCR